MLIARLLGKQHIMGVSDPFTAISPAERSKKLSECMTLLLKDQVLFVSEKNKFTVREEYHGLVETCCGSRCLMVILYLPGEDTVQLVCWPCQERFLTATVSNGVYTFSDGDLLEQKLNSFFRKVSFSRKSEDDMTQFKIPNVILRKAKQLTDRQDRKQAITCLRKGGADQIAASEIIEAFQGNRGFLHLSMAERSDNTTELKTMSFIFGETGPILLEPVVMNLRSSVKFQAIGDVENSIRSAICRHFSGDALP